MIRLDSTTKTIVAKLSGAVTTTQPDYNSSWDDIRALPTRDIIPGSTDGLLNDTSYVTIAAAPAASYYRNIKYVSIYNADTVTVQATVYLDNNGTKRALITATLEPGYALIYNDGYSWTVMSDAGEQGMDVTGISGFSGYSGTSGFSGFSGVSGFSGYSGVSGFSGVSGYSGTLGIGSEQTLTDGATITWNYALGYNAKVTLAGSRTLSITNTTAGDYGTVRIIQDGTGGRDISTWPTNSKFVDGVESFTAAGGASDIYVFYYDGTNYWWNFNKNFS